MVRSPSWWGPMPEHPTVWVQTGVRHRRLWRLAWWADERGWPRVASRLMKFAGKWEVLDDGY